MTGRTLRVLIADDHEVVRCGVRGLLEAHGYTVVGEASDGLEAIEKAASLAPDVLIVDITMPRLNGLEAARRIRAVSPHTEILVLSMHQSEQMVREVLEAGVRGYVLKADATKDLVAAVEALGEHRPYFTGQVAQQLLNSFLTANRSRDDQGADSRRLTPREREIIQLLAEGRSNKEIATLIHLSVKTVETHRSNLMRKLGLHSLSDLIHYALRNNLIVH